MKLATVVLAGFLAACTTIAPAVTVTSRQLNENPATYDGDDVSVRGMLVLGTNGRSIYQSAERFDQWVKEFSGGDVDFAAYRDDCLTLAGPGADALVENQYVLHKRTVTLRGAFVADFYSRDTVDLQKCANQSALVVDMASARSVIRSAGANVK